MYIVIVGDGKVGIELTEQLSKEGHDVVVIDRDPQVVEEVVNAFDVKGLCGNGATYGAQEEAGVGGADLLIAATSADEVNILCCLVARKLGAKRTIARVRNPEYLGQLPFMQEDLQLSMVVNPEFEAAREIARVLRFPSAAQIESFGKGRVDLVEVRIPAGSPLCEARVSELSAGKRKVLICAVQRGEEVFIPSGAFVLQAGDRIHLTASAPDMADFFKNKGLQKARVKGVMIIGGGKIGQYLAQMLTSSGMEVKIIEIDKVRCLELSEQVPKAAVIWGDGTEQELLDEEGLDRMDALVALTGIDEENIIISMYANLKKTPKVITKINRNSFAGILGSLGLDTVISPKSISADRIVSYTRALQNSTGSAVKTLYKLVDGKVEALEFEAGEDDGAVIGRPLRDLRLRSNLLIACIIRRNKLIYPTGEDRIEKGDRVVVVTANKYLSDLREILQ